MQVFVLIDTSDAAVYGVVTDSDAADKWTDTDANFSAIEVEVDDYQSYNEMLDEVEDGAEEDAEVEEAEE
jgi:hypothetical protein